MKLGLYKQLDFPLNLWSTVLDREISVKDLPEDWSYTLNYLLQTLKNDRERESLLYFFKDTLTFEEIGAHWNLTSSRAREIAVTATRRLRHPARQLILTLGLTRVLREKPDYERLHTLDPEMFPETGVPPLPSQGSPVPGTAAQPPCSLDMAIEDLDFSVRTWHCLRRSNIRTLRDLLKHTEEDLLRIRNFGQKCLWEIQEQLSPLGLSLEAEHFHSEQADANHLASTQSGNCDDLSSLASLDRSELISEILQLRAIIARQTEEIADSKARLSEALDACRTATDKLNATQSALEAVRIVNKALRQQHATPKSSSPPLSNQSKGEII